MAKFRPEQIEVVTGTTDNATIPTQGWTEEHVGNSVSNGMWTKTLTELKPTDSGDTVEIDGTLKVDTITELTPSNGVDIELIKIQDNTIKHETGGGDFIISSGVKTLVLSTTTQIRLSSWALVNSSGLQVDTIGQKSGIDMTINGMTVTGLTNPAGVGSLTLGGGGVSVNEFTTTIDAASTDIQVPTAKAVYDGVNANGILDLTSAEVTQLANIDTTTISITQWGYLGAMNQGVVTTDSPTFVGATLSGLANGLVKSTTGVLSGGNSVTLTSEVSGVLPIANGGTNSSTALGNDKVMISSAGTIIESATITTTELGLLNGIASVSTGIGDNDKFVTQGYVDDAIAVEDIWDRVTGTPNYVIPATIADDIGATGARITKGWFTDIESTNMPTIGGTSINANAVLDLTSAEVTQLANIDTTTISTTQWGYLGAMNQGVATTDTPIFSNMTIGTGATGVDYVLTFDGENTDGTITWMEDEGEMRFGRASTYFGFVLGVASTDITSTNGTINLDNTITDSPTLFKIIGNGNSGGGISTVYGNDASSSASLTQTATTTDIDFGPSVSLFNIRGNTKIASGTFALASGTTVNEIVVSVSGSSTDNQLATAKAVYDAVLSSDQVSPPATPTSTGTAGQWAYGSGYSYRCTATDTWIRWAVVTSW